jgi:hypothetical protein
MTDIAFMLVKQFVVRVANLSDAIPEDTWLHHTEFGLANTGTECEST